MSKELILWKILYYFYNLNKFLFELIYLNTNFNLDQLNDLYKL